MGVEKIVGLYAAKEVKSGNSSQLYSPRNVKPLQVKEHIICPKSIEILPKYAQIKSSKFHYSIATIKWSNCKSQNLQEKGSVFVCVCVCFKYNNMCHQ